MQGPMIPQWMHLAKHKGCKTQCRAGEVLMGGCMFYIRIPCKCTCQVPDLAMTSFRDVISQCSASRFVQQHMAHLRSGWPCMTSVMLPGSLAMTSHLDVIPQCSASAFVLQQRAHLGIRWPCITSIMLPVYRAITYILYVILVCSASQFVQQHMVC